MSEYIIDKVSKLSVKGLMRMLPPAYKQFLAVKTFRRTACVKCSKGWIAFYTSKDYSDVPKWRVKPFDNNSEVEIAYWAFGLDLRGMLLIPSDIVINFCDSHTISKTPSGKWKMGIHEFNERYFLCSQDCQQDVSEFFLQSTRILKSLDEELSIPTSVN